MKIIKIAFSFLVIFLVVFEFYHYFQNDGNLIFIIQNQSESKEVLEVGVFLKERTILKDSFHNNLLVPKENTYSLFGYQIIEVSCQELSLSKKISFWSFLIRWVVVDVYSDKIVVNSYYLTPFFQ